MIDLTGIEPPKKEINLSGIDPPKKEIDLTGIDSNVGTASLLDKAQADVGRGIKNAIHLAADVAATIGPQLSGGVGFDIDPVTKKLKLKNVDRESIKKGQERTLASIDKFLDVSMHTEDPTRQHTTLTGKLIGGFVEFLPQAPLYEFTGGQSAVYVRHFLAKVGQKYGPAIEKMVAEKLPEAIAKSGKYVAEVGVHGLEQGAMGATTQALAGHSGEEIAGEAASFALFSMAFKGLKDPFKAAKKKFWSTPEERAADEGLVRPDRLPDKYDILDRRPYWEQQQGPYKPLDLDVKTENVERGTSEESRPPYQKPTDKEPEQHERLKEVQDKITTEEAAAKEKKEILDARYEKIMAGKKHTTKPDQYGAFTVSSIGKDGEVLDTVYKSKKLPGKIFHDKYELIDAMKKRKEEREADYAQEKNQEELHSFNPFGMFKKQEKERSVYGDLAKAAVEGKSETIKPDPQETIKNKLARDLGYNPYDKVPEKMELLKEVLKQKGVDFHDSYKHPKHGELVTFTDPKTGSTLMMQADKMTPEAVEAHIKESRSKWPKEELHTFNPFAKPRSEWEPEHFSRFNQMASQASGVPFEPVDAFWDYALTGMEKSSPTTKTVFDFTKRTSHKLRNFLDLNGLPELNRLGVGEESFAFGGSHIASQRYTDDWVAKVMGENDYQNPRKKAMLMSILVKDRIISGYEYNKGELNKMREEYDKVTREINTAQEEIYLYETRFEDRKMSPEQQEHYEKLIKDMEKLEADQTSLEHQAKRQEKIVNDIREEHDIPDYEQYVLKALQNDYMIWGRPEQGTELFNIKDKIEAWNEHVTKGLDDLYKDTKSIDPAEKLEEHGTYGKYTKTRLSLITKGEKSRSASKHSKEEGDLPTLRSKNYVDQGGTANVGRDPHDTRAYFTGEYTLSMEKNLNNTLNKRMEYATKENLLKALEEKNVVQFGPRPAGELPDGNTWKEWNVKVERPISEKVNGIWITKLEHQQMWVRSEAMTELESLFNVHPEKLKFPFTDILTRTQILGPADFVSHGKNLLSEVARAQGKGKSADKWTRIPIVGAVDASKRISDVWKEVRADGPGIRAELKELADLGVLRPPHGKGEGGLPTGKWLYEMDTASRVLMHRFHKQLVKEKKMPDAKESARNFVNLVGQYNARFMQPWMRRMRNMGLAPFIVAGRNFNRAARYAATGNVGVKAKTKEAQAEMMRLNLQTVAMAATIPMMINTFTTGNPLGRPGTPLFGVDPGKEKNEDGSIDTFDFGTITGLARFTRMWGINDLYQGTRAGQTGGQIAKKAAWSGFQGRVHPWAGPAPKFAENWADKGLGYAAKNLNPLLTSPFMDPRYGDWETKIAPESGERTAVSRVGTFLDALWDTPSGALGFKHSRAPRSAAEQFANEHRFMSKEGLTADVMKSVKLRQKAEKVIKKDEAEGEKYLQKLVDEGMDASFADRIWRERNMAKLQRDFNSLSVDRRGSPALETYSLGTIEEKAMLYRQLEQKIMNKENDLAPARFEELNEFLENAYNEIVDAIESGKLKPEQIYEKE